MEARTYKTTGQKSNAAACRALTKMTSEWNRFGRYHNAPDSLPMATTLNRRLDIEPREDGLFYGSVTLTGQARKWVDLYFYS